MATIMADFERDVLPGVTHWQHPNFFAYFSANSSPPSVLAEMLTATLGAQCMLWQTSPAATEMETRMLDWLRQMMGLPEGFHGVIQDSASSAILCAILTARERATGWRSNEAGLASVGQRLAVYASEEAHSATEKAVKIAGIGRQMLRKIEADEQFALRPDALADAIRKDLAAGVIPACVVASLRHHRDRRHRPAKADRRALSGARHLSPRRRRLGGECVDFRGISLDAGGHRVGRQLGLQPAQMAVHQFRLLGPFRPRPGCFDPHADDLAGISEVARSRSSDRLSRLGRAAWVAGSGRSSSGS